MSVTWRSEKNLLTPEAAELARGAYYEKHTRKIHRKRFWKSVFFQVRKPFMLAFCVLGDHEAWQHQSLLGALASGKSERCKWCNRLVLKKEYRQ